MESKELKFDFNYEVISDNIKIFDLTFKLIIIGDSGVGKSCITQQASKQIFEETYNSTIGFEYFVFNIKIDDKIIKLQLWDTCGQEAYRSLISSFYRNSSLAIMVYNITNKKSFENIDSWYKELKTCTNPDIKVFLIGNKIDLEDQREVSTEEGEMFKENLQLDKFVECSAKTGFNAQNIFIEAAKLLYDDYKLHQKDKEQKDYYSESAKGETDTIDNASDKISCDANTLSRKTLTKKKKCC